MGAQHMQIPRLLGAVVLGLVCTLCVVTIAWNAFHNSDKAAASQLGFF